MRVVLDTNVIISAVLFDGVPEQTVLSILGGSHILVLSPFVIEETSRILKDRFDAQPNNIKLLQRLLSKADIVYPEDGFINELDDDPDNRVLETAVSGKADYIVTGDKLMLGLEQFQDIKIIKPAEWLGRE